MKDIGSRIRSARKEAKLTLEQLGSLLGLTKGAISQWETGRTAPDLSLIPEICRDLRVSADYLVRGLDVSFLDEQSVTLARRISTLTPEQQVALRDLFAPPSGDDDEHRLPPPNLS